MKLVRLKGRLLTVLVKVKFEFLKVKLSELSGLPKECMLFRQLHSETQPQTT